MGISVFWKFRAKRCTVVVALTAALVFAPPLGTSGMFEGSRWSGTAEVYAASSTVDITGLASPGAVGVALNRALGDAWDGDTVTVTGKFSYVNPGTSGAQAYIQVPNGVTLVWAADYTVTNVRSATAVVIGSSAQWNADKTGILQSGKLEIIRAGSIRSTYTSAPDGTGFNQALSISNIEATLNGGTVVAEGGPVSSGTTVTRAIAVRDSSLTILSGEVRSVGRSASTDIYGISCYDSSIIIMKGGTVSVAADGISAADTINTALAISQNTDDAGDAATLNIEGGTISIELSPAQMRWHHRFLLYSDAGTSGSAIVKNAVLLADGDINVSDAVDPFSSLASAVFYDDPAPDDDVYVGTVIGDVTLAEGHTLAGDLTIPSGASLTVPAGTTLTIPDGVTLTIAEGATLTVAGGGTLVNNGTLANSGTLAENGAYSGNGVLGGTGAFAGKSLQSAPPAPTLASKSSSSVVLNALTGCLYSRDGVTWQAGASFAGLSSDTSYTFYQKYAGTATRYPSPKSPGLTVVTDKAPAAKDKTTSTAKAQAAPPKTKITKLAVGKRLVKVTFKKVAKKLKVTKYQVQYRVKGAKKWKSKSFKVKYTGAASAKVTVKKLKKGKRYQFRVRAWKTVSGKKAYAPWSAAKLSGKVR